MWAVYFTGCTDSFLQAIFIDLTDAQIYAQSTGREEGISDGDYTIKYWKTISDIDTTDTGWEHE